jgi:tRNA threonylcarbamoyl adenosine modification protein (Sua5/YciO/YrdC/YwlC family)
VSLVFRCDLADDRAAGLQGAAAAARRGDLVVLPTETVYGLATDAFSHRGLEAMRAAKGRGRDLPVPVFVPRPRTVDGLVYQFSDAGRDLVEAFWPGPLTVVAWAQPSLSWDLGEARGTVSLRMPLHPVALELLRETGPLAVTSANRAGMAAPTTAQEAQAQLAEDVWIYLDAGPLPPGETSTVVDVTGEVPRVVRDGALAVDLLREVVPDLLSP